MIITLIIISLLAIFLLPKAKVPISIPIPKIIAPKGELYITPKEEIGMQFQTRGINEYGQSSLYDCTATNDCTVNGYTVVLDDPHNYEPTATIAKITIPVKNIGNANLTITGEATADNQKIYSETFTLEPNEQKLIILEQTLNLQLGTVSKTITISVSGGNASFSYQMPISSTLYRAILQGPSESEIKHNIIVTADQYYPTSKYEESYNKITYSCTGTESSCSFSTQGNNIQINLQNPANPIESANVDISFPIRNVGNKAFSNLYANTNYGAISLPTGAASLEAGQTAYVHYTFTLTPGTSSGSSNIQILDTNFAAISGKRLQIPFNINPTISQYYNPSCFRSIAIDYGNPQIVSLANSIAGSDASVYDKANDIFKWVYYNIGTWPEKNERGSIGRLSSVVLENKYGVCSDRATIFTGLARAAGIPPENVQVVYGKVCWLWQSDPECDSNPEGYHAWIAIYYNNKWNQVEMRSIELDFLNKNGLQLGIEAGRLYHDYLATLALTRYKPEYYYNDEYCEGSFY